MLRYDVVLADQDDTLFDFSGSTRQALREVLSALGRAATPAMVEDYLAINQRWWERYERGEIPKAAIYAGRFAELFGRYGIDADPAAANGLYKDRLCACRRFIPGCEALLRRLQPHAEVYLVTNGVADTQARRLAASGMAHLFRGVFVSETMGCRKPEKRFFDLVFAAIGEEKRPRAIILGDSFTSDMQGGRNAGIATCLLGDPARADGRCDYAIRTLAEFPAILGLDEP